MKHMKKNHILLILLVVLLVLSSCDKFIETPSPDVSPEITATPALTPTEEPSTPTATPIVVPTPTPTPIPTPTPTPIATPVPEKPEAFTPEQYFTFDAMHGVILDYDIEGGRYVNIPSSIGGVEVVKIGEDTFRGKDIYGVIIPDTVKIIGKSAFEWCGYWEESSESNAHSIRYGIKELTLGSNVETIEDNAFYNCIINNLVLPGNIKYIGDAAFSSNFLSSIVIPDSVTYIGDSAFSGNFLSSIVIPDSVTYIGDSAFSGNILNSIVIPDSVMYIGSNAFGGLTEDKITLGKGVTSFWVVEGNIFLGHIGKPAPNLIIPYFSGVDTIGEYALSSCDLKSVTIPDNISIIERGAFGGNNGLNITISGSVISISEYCFADDTVINCEAGSYAEYYAKKRRLTCVINGNVDATSFPVERNEIINANISIISKQDFQHPFENWVRQYISSKYYSNEITSIRLSKDVYVSEDLKYYIYDKTDSSILDNGYIVKTKQYQVALSVNKNIEGMTGNNSGNYNFYIQVIVVCDKNGLVVLSGFLQGEENMLESRTDLYSYIALDNRFTSDGYTETESILDSSEKTKIVNIADHSIITELIKDVDYVKANYKEEYIPLNKDIVAFFAPEPVSTVYIVDLSNNSIIFTKKYPRSTYLSVNDEICAISYYISNTKYFDKVNALGQMIEEKVVEDYYPDAGIPGTSYKIVQDGETISLYNTATNVNNILIKTKATAGVFWGKGYVFKEVVDSNRFIYICGVHNGYVPSDCYTYIYDIRDGSSVQLYDVDSLVRYAGHYGDEYFASSTGDYSDPACEIYIITMEGADEGKLISITENVDMCMAIKDFAFTSDGKYLVMLTSIHVSEEYEYYAGSEHIVILDTETKKVLYQDELIMERGKITHFLDDTFCISDGKTLIYIDLHQ
jgi:hypothetical protein